MSAAEHAEPANVHQHSPGTEKERGLEGFEKLRVVGKGAFGLAVLYRRQSDGELVVIKEVNIIELSASERQFALNEVQVLASLNHPNIISYHRSFERDGQLMIEMEYADGGNLNQLLARRRRPFSERAILHIYSQICAALRHMHERGVLHRDLKTANVFLTRNFAVKVGDFGISKVLTTRAQAQTILGTPYYISPEMCEGKEYGPKSDIWASGCILYEMVCLHKAFEATNLPALVNRIIKGEFDPIPENYSAGLAQLVRDILQRDPDSRPSAGNLCDDHLPPLIAASQPKRGGNFLDPGQSRPTFISLDLSQGYGTQTKIRSILYSWRSHGAEHFDLEPISLPANHQITEVAVGDGHILVVTTDNIVFSWGVGSKGQLGHGVMEARRDFPHCIDALRGKSINKVAAGHEFSIFGNEGGLLMSCGAGEKGCLGHNDVTDSPRPRIIEAVMSVDISEVKCGPYHVAALSRQGKVFTWGQGQNGRLGNGKDESRFTPEEIDLPSDINREHLKLRVGTNSTAVITSNGDVIAWGSNKFNKLGLDRKGICGLFTEVDDIWKPTLVPLDFAIVDLSMGARHTALLSRTNQVYILGPDPATPQLPGPRLITTLGDNIKMVTCGHDFTIAGTEDNVIYFWGIRHHFARDQFPEAIQLTSAGDKMECIKVPQEILALYGAESSYSLVPYLGLGGVLAASASEKPGTMYLLLHTSAPTPDRHPSEFAGVHFRTVRSANPHQTQPNRSESVPDWLKAELAAATPYHH